MKTHPILEFLHWLGVGAFGILFAGCAQSSFLHGLTGGAGTLAQARTVEGKCDVIVRWASRFEDEYPDWFELDLPRSKHRRIDIGSALDDHQQRFANLYRDEWFVPVFGKSYDQLSLKEKNSISVNSLLPCNDPKKYQRAARFQRYEVLTRPLVGGALQIKNAVGEARTLQKDMAATLVTVREYPASKDNYWRVEKQREQWEQKIDHFWPSERDPFLQTLEAESRRQLLVALPAMITEGVNATDYEGVLALHHFPKDHPGMFDEVPSEVATRERRRMKEGVSDGLARLLKAELQRLDARGTGLPSLKAEGARYVDIDTRYLRIFGQHPSISSALDEFVSLREPDLAANAGTVTTLLRQASTVSQLDIVTKDYVIPPLDGKSAAGQPLVAIIENRRPWMVFEEEERWKFAAHEVSLMEKPGLVAVPRNYGPPDPEEIRLAILRAFVKEGGELITPYVVKWHMTSVERMLESIGMRSPVAQPRVPIPFGTIRFRHIDPARCQAAPDAGYRCHYQADFKWEVGGVSFPVPDSWFVNDHFVLTDQGWTSPSARDTVARKNIELLGKGFENIQGGGR
jgi:hypothetical protein